MTKRALFLIAAALLMTGSCGGKRSVGANGPKSDKSDASDKGDESDGGSDDKTDPGAAQLRQVTVVEWVTTTNTADPPKTEVLISLTDETGAVEHKTIGTFTGSCTEGIDDADTPDAIIGLRCWFAGAGDSLRIVRKGSEIIVLRALLEEESDEVSYDIYGRFPIRTDCFVKGPSDQ